MGVVFLDLLRGAVAFPLPFLPWVTWVDNIPGSIASLPNGLLYLGGRPLGIALAADRSCRYSFIVFYNIN